MIRHFLTTLLFLGLSTGCAEDISIPLQRTWWETPPHVQHCATASVTPQEIRAELQWWKALSPDYQWASVTVNAECGHRAPFGYLYIKDITQERLHELGAGGITHWVTGNLTLRSATVLIGPRDMYTDEHFEHVLHHEMGHAWGWCHAPIGHVMGPSLHEDGVIYSEQGLSDYGKVSNAEANARIPLCRHPELFTDPSDLVAPDRVLPGASGDSGELP